ncbi:phytoene desaturase [Candidatus Saccharibacteria bacterium CPR2]|nr:phytoene desaturase [Candidatus Saccharibacteria bacterium CPR2]
MKITVIGGGFSGLAAAALLSNQGNEVTILEKNRHVGGRADYHTAHGFSFDLGPTWYLMGQVIDDLFRELGENRENYYDLVRLDPMFRVITPQGYRDVKAGFEDSLNTFEKMSPGSSEDVTKLLVESRRAYEIMSSKLQDDGNQSESIQLRNWAYNQLKKFNLLRSYHGFLKQSLKSQEIKDLLETIPMQLGLNPVLLPAFHIFWLASLFDDGLWYPVGGFKKVVESLEKLALSQGVDILCSENVSKININKGKIKGVTTKEETFFADSVVSAMDYAFTETKLVPYIYRTYPKTYWKSAAYSSSAIIMNFGVQGNLGDSLAVHNVFIDENWHDFCLKLKSKKSTDNIQFFATLSSLADKSLAPEGCSCLRVVLPFPTGMKMDINRLSELRQAVIEKIERHVGKRLDIVYEQIKPPGYYKSRFNAYNSSAFGLAHTTSQNVVMRPPNKSLKVSGLYYVGQDTKPGVSIPFVITSARTVADEIKKSSNHARRR